MLVEVVVLGCEGRSSEFYSMWSDFRLLGENK